MPFLADWPTIAFPKLHFDTKTHRTRLLNRIFSENVFEFFPKQLVDTFDSRNEIARLFQLFAPRLGTVRRVEEPEHAV